jgi:ABC-2 type transport system ATP-binding protein
MPPKHTSAPSAISVHSINVLRNKHHILHDVSLSVPQGTVVGLLGPSGCGKTTLMRAIVGVQALSSGSIDVLGLPAAARSLRGRIGYVTQETAVYRDLTVWQNVAYFAALYGAPRSSIARAIATVKLDARATYSVRKLSGGESGRASLACALVSNPEVLVLDEPTVGLDPLTREELWRTFRELAASGHTLIISSHVMDEATRCDSLVLMRDGHVLAHLTPRELLTRTNTNDPDAAFLALIEDTVTAETGSSAAPEPATAPAHREPADSNSGAKRQSHAARQHAPTPPRGDAIEHADWAAPRGHSDTGFTSSRGPGHRQAEESGAQ